MAACRLIRQGTESKAAQVSAERRLPTASKTKRGKLGSDFSTMTRRWKWQGTSR